MKWKRKHGWGMSPKEVEAIDEVLNPHSDVGTVTLPIVVNACARQNCPSPIGPMDPEREAVAERGLGYIREEQQRFRDYRNNRNRWRW